MTQLNKKKFVFYSLMINLVCTSLAHSLEIDSTSPPPPQIASQFPGIISTAIGFNDSLGKHILIFTRDQKEFSDDKKAILLKATQFLQIQSTWKQEWQIKDGVECQGVDMDGNFLKNLTRLTDLDNNKIIETSVAYFTICAGGIEPKTTKAIMRQGEIKYAVRGESLIKIDDKTSLGGTFIPDKALDAKPEFKSFLIELWKKAGGVL